MFENRRMLTKTIDNEIHPYIQLFLWGRIDWLKKEMKLDSWQVFTLETIRGNNPHEVIQVVIHKQENPKFEQVSYIPWFSLSFSGYKPIDAKILVIDDGEFSTMMFANEY